MCCGACRARTPSSWRALCEYSCAKAANSCMSCGKWCNTRLCGSGDTAAVSCTCNAGCARQACAGASTGSSAALRGAPTRCSRVSWTIATLFSVVARAAWSWIPSAVTTSQVLTPRPRSPSRLCSISLAAVRSIVTYGPANTREYRYSIPPHIYWLLQPLIFSLDALTIAQTGTAWRPRARTRSASLQRLATTRCTGA